MAMENDETAAASNPMTDADTTEPSAKRPIVREMPPIGRRRKPRAAGIQTIVAATDYETEEKAEQHLSTKVDEWVRGGPKPGTIRAQVREFRRAFGLPCSEEPAVPDEAKIRLAMGLVVEEFMETIRAVFQNSGAAEDAEIALEDMVHHAPINVDLVELADGLSDLAYVTEGAAQTFGINSCAVNAEVHRSNMAKASGPRSETGKILKPAGWTPPDVEFVLKAYGWRP